MRREEPQDDRPKSREDFEEIDDMASTGMPLEEPCLAPKEHAAPGYRSERLILAEDDGEMRRLLAWALEKDGYEVVEVPDGRMLLERVAISRRIGDPVDLVIADVRMPGLTGLQALKRLRSAGCDAPVIFITAFGDTWTHMEAELLGAFEVLDKPFELDELRDAVRRVWRLRRSHRRHQN